MNLNHYFHTCTNFPSRQFQLQTIQKLLNRQDILLRTPTDSGKTETVIASLNYSASPNFAQLVELPFYHWGEMLQ
jgi:CRISPR-associated endonuclease/helicase Cas3